MRRLEFEGSAPATADCGAMVRVVIGGGMPQGVAGCMADSGHLSVPVDRTAFANLLVPATTTAIPLQGFAHQSWRCCAPTEPFAFTVVPLLDAVSHSPLPPAPTFGATLALELVEP